MRKVMIIVLVFALLICFAGCVKYDVNIKVNKNGTIDMSFLYAVNNELLSLGELSDDSDMNVMTQEDIASYKDQGFIVDDYAAGGYTGYIISKQGISLNEGNNALSDSDLYGSYTKNGNTYIIDIDLSKIDGISDITEFASYIKQSGGSVSITIELPLKPKVHNATSVSDDGKVLTWDILSMNVNENIHLEFTTINMPLIIGIAVVITIMAIVLIATSKKKKSTVNNDASISNDDTLIEHVE